MIFSIFKNLINLISIIIIFYSPCSIATQPILRIYTVEAFAASFAAGGKIKTIFEEQCKCKVEYITFDSSSSLVARLKLEGSIVNADLIIGVDENVLEQLKNTKLFSEHHLDLSKLSLPFEWKDPVFVPYNYGYFAFIYNDQKINNPPSSFLDLIDPKNKFTILMSDPRSSTSGLGLVDWVKAAYPQDSTIIWKKLAPKIVTVTKSWSEAYGLFLKNEADFVLSYTTSPAYHLMAENNSHYKAALFNEGHYVQIQLAAKLKTGNTYSIQDQLAEQFLQFIISQPFQETIPQDNYMYPVINLKNGLPAAYHSLIKPAHMLHFSTEVSDINRKAWVDEWLTAMKP